MLLVALGWFVVVGIILTPVVAGLCWLPWVITTPDTATIKVAFGVWYAVILAAVLWFTGYAGRRMFTAADDELLD